MRLAATAIAGSFAATTALAQPLPVPASYPPVVGEKGVVTTHEISLDMAEKIARAGIEACRKMGFHTTMVVIDSGGTMKAFLRDEKTGPHTVTLAQDKAFTALTLASRFASSATFATARNSTLGSPMTNIRGVVGVGGGVPIKYHGDVIGAVASSGAVGGDKDELCSQAGIDAVADQLK
ncbi:MAG TPA: heme-binding protein [Rhizomicrobium sp.]